mmetsp:Transcript_257/g.792  ORF Transcript_257/g.792 Transcript_257/m.792 type:complete len:201 (-) Transcript_257:272-874(-)
MVADEDVGDEEENEGLRRGFEEEEFALGVRGEHGELFAVGDERRGECSGDKHVGDDVHERLFVVDAMLVLQLESFVLQVLLNRGWGDVRRAPHDVIVLELALERGEPLRDLVALLFRQRKRGKVVATHGRGDRVNERGTQQAAQQQRSEKEARKLRPRTLVPRLVQLVRPCRPLPRPRVILLPLLRLVPILRGWLWRVVR